MPVYLDHAATTPMRAAAIEAMVEQLGKTGNPSSLHTAGRAARRVVEESREIIAAAVGARPSEVLFTSGGTEADNLAVLGTLRAMQPSGRRRVVASAIEHHAVLDPIEQAVQCEQAVASWVPADRDGRLTPDALREALGPTRSDVALVTLMWANNEVGTVQDIPLLSGVLAEDAAMAPGGPAKPIPLHTDASQAIGYLPVDFASSGATTMTIAGHKVGGPLGVGALIAARDAPLTPLQFGGGQERGIRSGTLDAPAIRAFAVACQEAVSQREGEAARLAQLRDALIEGALALDEGIQVTGWWEPGDVSRRLPGNVHLLIDGAEGDSLLYLLDAVGIACSTGSACQAGVPRPSHVVLALGYPESQARGALRLTLGHSSTQADVEALLAALPQALARTRRAAGTT